jgi:hypothetical protein
MSEVPLGWVVCGYCSMKFNLTVGSASVQGAGCRGQGAGCRVQGAGFRVQGSGFRVQGSGCRVQDAGCRVQGSRFRVRESATARERERSWRVMQVYKPVGSHSAHQGFTSSMLLRRTVATQESWAEWRLRGILEF